MGGSMGQVSKDDRVVSIRVCDYDGFAHSCMNMAISKEAYEHRYVNNQGSVFIQWNGDLYVMIPGLLDFSYEKVRSNKQIDKAFDVDRYCFNNWLHNK